MSANAALLRIFSLLSMLFMASPALATDFWVLANGDRLTGALVAETDSGIEIDHPQLGRLVIAWEALQKPAGPSVVEKAVAPDVAPVNTVAATSSVPLSRVQWIRQLDFGYARQDGAKSRQELSARAQIEARAGRDNYRGTARVLRAESQGVLTSDRHEADFRWRREFNKRLFGQALTTYASDDIRKINLSLEQQVGGGYRIIDGERQKLNLGLGAVLQRLAREGYENHTALLGSAFQDYAFALNDRFRITQEATFLVSDEVSMAVRGGQSALPLVPSQGGNFRLRFNTNLQSKMTSQISLNLRYEYDYDRSLPDPNLRTDSRLTTSLGYSW
jgi:putative salt-induced outer membrane protein YdiY